jgi:clan AA aspartic protease
MTSFSVQLEIGDRQEANWETVQALVDTGSTYTWVPRNILERLGVRPEFSREFQTADGRIVPREMSVAAARLNGQTLPTLVVIAEPGDAVLLGMYTLEGFSLGIDPVNERLIPVRGLAMTSSPLLGTFL